MVRNNVEGANVEVFLVFFAAPYCFMTSLYLTVSRMSMLASKGLHGPREYRARHWVATTKRHPLSMGA